MESGKWQEGGITVNLGQQRGQFYLTGDHNLRTETHTGIHVKVYSLTSRSKSDKISASKTDRQEAYLYQTRAHC